MLKKYFYLFLILSVLVLSCVLEEFLVNKYLKDIDFQVSQIQTFVSDKKNINTNEILFMVESLDDAWHSHEAVLCLLVNHKDMEDIGLEIARLKSNISTNQVEDFNASLSLIRFFTDTYHHVMGTNIFNVLWHKNIYSYKKDVKRANLLKWRFFCCEWNLAFVYVWQKWKRIIGQIVCKKFKSVCLRLSGML